MKDHGEKRINKKMIGRVKKMYGNTEMRTNEGNTREFKSKKSIR